MIRISMALLLAALAAQPALLAITADEVVAKHIAARGGRDAWDQVGALRLAGEFTGFSQINAFTLIKTADGRYHLDHVLGDKPVVIGWDGQTAWWDNRWFQEGAQKIVNPNDLGVLMREVEFPLTPFFDIEAAGHQVKLIGETEVEGIPALGIELTRADGTVETWYLDPDSFLEVARDSPGSDFGRQVPQRTFFDSFEAVGDTSAVMPHYVESQFYTRHRVMDVRSVETGVAVDDTLFRLPPPMGMEPVLGMVGAWHVKVELRAQPGAPWQSSERMSTVTAELGGALLRERFASGGGEVERTLTYDRFRKDYVLTQVNDQTTYLDIMRGPLAEGAVTTTNLETGTSRDQFGLNIFGRMTVSGITEAGFSIEHASSIDGGESWFVDAKLTYSRDNGSEP